MSAMNELLRQVLPQQDYASLRSPGQPALEGALFAPHRRRIPFLPRTRGLRPRAGVPIKVESHGEAGSYSFLSQLIGFEASGRMLLAMPANVTQQAVARQELPEGTELQLLCDGDWIIAPIARLDSRGITFLFSAYVARLLKGRRVRARLDCSVGPRQPAVLEIDRVQIAPGTGERIAQARFIALCSPLRAWLQTLD